MTAPALRHRPFRIYVSGQIVSLSGTWMHLVAQGWLVWEISKDEAIVGGVSAAGFGATLVFSVLGGAAADRFERRRILIITQAAALVLAATLGLVCLTSTPALWEIVAIVIGLGIVNAFDLPTRHALVADLVPAEDLVSAVALNQVLFNLARVVGPAVAGVLIAHTTLGPGGVFLINAASYLAILAALVCLPPSRAHGAAHAHGLFDGLGYVARTPALRAVLLLVAGAGIFGWSLPVVLPSLAASLASDASLYGTMTSAIGGGAIAGAVLLVWTTSRVPRLVLIPSGLALWAGALAAATLVPDIPLVVACLAIGGLGMIQFTGSANAFVQEIVPGALRGRVMGVWSMVYALAEPIGAVQAGQLARALGPRGELRVAALIMAAIGVVWLAVTVETRRRYRP